MQGLSQPPPRVPLVASQKDKSIVNGQALLRCHRRRRVVVIRETIAQQIGLGPVEIATIYLCKEGRNTEEFKSRHGNVAPFTGRDTKRTACSSRSDRTGSLSACSRHGALPNLPLGHLAFSFHVPPPECSATSLPQ